MGCRLDENILSCTLILFGLPRFWVWSGYGEETEEMREVLIPGGRPRLIGRILRIQDDYDIRR